MPAALPLRLGVNIDHVATIRNARGGDHPSPLRAAELATIAEAARAEAVRQATFDPDNLVKLEGAADRALRRLKLPAMMPNAEPSLTDYLASLGDSMSSSPSDSEMAAGESGAATALSGHTGAPTAPSGALSGEEARAT